MKSVELGVQGYLTYTSTLTHWHCVRKSKLQNIIPFIGNVDFVVNSAMPYEFPALKACYSTFKSYFYFSLTRVKIRMRNWFS